MKLTKEGLPDRRTKEWTREEVFDRYKGYEALQAAEEDFRAPLIVRGRLTIWHGNDPLSSVGFETDNG